MVKSQCKLTILFIPEAGIYPYLRSLAVLGDAVAKNGKKVYLTHCTGQMLRCPMMANSRLATKASVGEKHKLCQKCQKQFRSAQKKYNFFVIELKDLVDGDTIQFVDSLSSMSQADLENLMFKNIAVGKISKYDFSLETKTQVYPNLSNDHKALYIAYIKNTVLAVVLAEKICINYSPSVLITFNQYAQCQGVRAMAAIHKIGFFATTLACHKNVDASLLILYERLNTFFAHRMKWHSIKDIPILPYYVSECWKDTIFHFYSFGSHIFSKSKHGDPVAIFEKFSLDFRKKTIIVYTSSNDERGGYEKLLKVWGETANFVDAFPNQIAWLFWLREYASKRDDIQIVVRIHPREGSRQFGFGSSHLKQLKEVFSENTKSFFVVWPDDPISSYDLIELADLCLVAWTTMGQEAARVGIPVLSCTGNMYYPDDDFIQVATTPEEYKKKLDAILRMEYTWQHLVKAVRFYHWRTFIPSLNLSETVTSYIENKRIWPEAPASKIDVINNIINGQQDLIEYNIKQWKNSLSVDAIEQELEAMRQGIRRLIDKVFYPRANLNHILTFYRKAWHKFIGAKVPFLKMLEQQYVDYHLEFVANSLNLEEYCKKTKNDKNLRILVATGLTAILVHKGKILRRMSPMIIRLTKLHDYILKNKDINKQDRYL